MNGAICGGIIKESEFNRRVMDNTVEEIMMAFVMPDKKLDKYWELKDKKKDKEATKLFKKFAYSII